MYTRARLGRTVSLHISDSLNQGLSLIDDDNRHSSSWLSLYTALTSPECQSAWAVARSLLGKHVRFLLYLCALFQRSDPVPKESMIKSVREQQQLKTRNTGSRRPTTD